MKLIALAGSLREDSCNKKFARAAAAQTELSGVITEFLDLKTYPMPAYDGDVETASGLPEATRSLSQKIAAADALIIATPEYNGGIPGTLKNVIDWLSRDKPNPLTGKHLLLLGASPGALGGIRGLWHSRQPFEAMGVHVYPSMMSLPDAYHAFTDSGALKDEKTAARLKELVGEFIAHASAHAGRAAAAA